MLTVDVVADDPRALACADSIVSALRSSFPRIDGHPQGEWAVTVLCAGSAEISRLHSEFFGDSSDTDVMSFPSGGDLSETEGYLGDVAISVDVAEIQAREQGHGLDRELPYLALHGVLHLLGYRDDADDDKQTMMDAQEKLFGLWVSERLGQT